jgi:hypothetical protein
MFIVNIIGRMFAVFVVNAFAVLAGGAILDIEWWKTLIIAGLIGVGQVLDDMARAYIADGKLTKDEVEQAFENASQSGDN